MEELHYSSGTVKAVTLYKHALAAIREALAEPVQEPKKWADLTSEEYEILCQGSPPLNLRVRQVAMALKSKNLGD